MEACVQPLKLVLGDGMSLFNILNVNLTDADQSEYAIFRFESEAVSRCCRSVGDISVLKASFHDGCHEVLCSVYQQGRAWRRVAS